MLKNAQTLDMNGDILMELKKIKIMMHGVTTIVELVTQLVGMDYLVLMM